ncbi:aldo/keto reductase [Paenibacillus sp. J2TS4]|uniref:aldo/keto reductase n=1 Tax=Paenibacillus sp. J2TS4 TaxID=2807194 RepID=UPI001B08F3F3|nr:aldo/keto reductase [Paenibacillus sp. J2TS4]GIP31179.1 oxidoreductase [Paenibacillus sp. J2TS4]
MKPGKSLPLREIGSSGLQVSSIGMGCMPLSIQGRPSEPDAIRTIHTAVEQGITLFDTADSYCIDDHDTGHNERLLAKALKGVTDSVIATKGGTVRPDGRWERNGRPEHLLAACEASLRALDREEIILYQLHSPDINVPFAESVGALARLQEQGKIVHIGLSNVSVEQLEEALTIVPVVSVQNRMNLFDHSSMDVLRRCEELGIAFLPYSPLNGMSKAGQLGDNETLRQITSRHEASPQRVALAWLLQLSPVMLPIPGASRPQSIADSAAAGSVQLSADEMEALSALGAAPA